MDILTCYAYLKRLRAKKSIPIDPEELRKGIQVELEHVDTINTLKKNPNITEEQGASMIAMDHIEEVEGKPYYSELEKMEKKLKSKHKISSLTAKILLKAISKDSSFYKEIPNAIKDIMEKYPEKYQELRQQLRRFFNDIIPHSLPRKFRDSIKEQIPQKYKVKDHIRKLILKMQPKVDVYGLKDFFLLIPAEKLLEKNPNDWNVLKDFIPLELIDLLKKHTLFTPKQFFEQLVSHNGNLAEIFKSDEYIL